MLAQTRKVMVARENDTNSHNRQKSFVCMPSLASLLISHVVVAPARSVDDNAHQATRNNTSAGEGDDPATVDPEDHTPVNGPPGSRAETDTDSGTRDTLSGGDRKLCGRVVSWWAPCGWNCSNNLLSLVAMITVTAAPNSIEKPREGEWRVIRLPRLRMIL